METWIQYLETQRTVANKDVVQLPLHLLDDDDNEEEEMKYNGRERLNDDIHAITKVRQVCISLINYYYCSLFHFLLPHMSVNDDFPFFIRGVQLAEKLNVIADIQQAIKYEEFMASMSRRYMDDMTKVLRSEILEHAQKRANELMHQFTRLRSLYTEQDALIGQSQIMKSIFVFLWWL